ncbi:hypothetical protein BaRGS_00022287 [Batillaria attramentaria]|uniref:Secreted protein n=1 Tax=Batillaria attramentaria TaxID=370345 RepID=A0ABD0KHT5_9CAEN
MLIIIAPWHLWLLADRLSGIVEIGQSNPRGRGRGRQTRGEAPAENCCEGKSAGDVISLRSATAPPAVHRQFAALASFLHWVTRAAACLSLSVRLLV